MRLIIILCPVTDSSCSVAAKSKGPTKSPDAGRRCRDRQLPCKAAEVLPLNPLTPSIFGGFIPAPSPGQGFGGQQAGPQPLASIHPPRTAGSTPAQPPALQTQQLLQARSETRKNSKAKGGVGGETPWSRQESLKRCGGTPGGQNCAFLALLSLLSSLSHP